jgi:glycosyltransferase involved in cell wall biosynthesis
MRVLFITGEFPPMQGGVGDCTNEIAKALVRCGVEADVLSTGVGPPSSVTESGVRVHRRVRRWDWRAIPLLRRALRETRADIVHIQYQTAAFGMHPAINLTPHLLRPLSPLLRESSGEGRGGRGSRVGIVTTFHDLKVPYLFPKAGPLREWITFELARASDAVIATNEADHARLTQRFGRRVSLIPIGSNITPAPPPHYERTAWRARWGVMPGELLLSYFGFLNDSKGGEILIRALAQIPHVRLLMIGGQVGASDATNVLYLARVKNLIAELGLDSRVLWTDYAPPEEVSASLLASDICVLPYRDGASFRRGSFMAALAHGLPIVTTLAPQSPLPSSERARVRVELPLPTLCDGENVLRVPPDDPRALAEAITRLIADSDLRARLNRGALELAQNFTWDKIATQHLALYDQLVCHKS